jgi:hypothetical protein
MKFDMSRAWNDATALLRANAQIVTILAGAFFFLPNLILMMLLAGLMGDAEATVASGASPQAAFEAAIAVYADVWWQLLLVTAITAVGMLGLLMLLTDRNRPTVQEAIRGGVTYLLPYIAAQILMSFAIVVLVVATLVVGRVAGPGPGSLVGLVATVAVIYVYVKFSLTVPVIAIERVGNPIRALGRSWALTKGNSVRLLLFYILLFIALLVIATVLNLIVGLIAALVGTASATFISSLLGSAINAVGITVYLAVVAAIYRQLASGNAQRAPTATAE